MIKLSDRREMAARVVARCRELAAYSEVAGETTRTFLSEPMREVHRLVAGWMTSAGMAVTVDAIGNVRGVFGGAGAPRLIIASHLDTVPNAGAFDGILGVMLGIAVVEAFAGAGLPIAIEVIGFSEEEGVRFRRPFLGSMALVGTLDEMTLGVKDTNAVTVSDAVRGFGLDPSRMGEARLSPVTKGYLEFHIEQGPVLESLGRALGVVTALVGQTRLEFTFAGHSNHAGTTPMHLRRDALAAASAWVVAVEELARGTDGLVATVGRIEAFPGAGNVVPGKVTALLDVRHAEDWVRGEAVGRLMDAAASAGAKRGVAVSHRVLMEQAAVGLDVGLTGMLEEAMRNIGEAPVLLASGAGHDAMIVAPHVASVMLFVRSPGGISHHPDEDVLLEDVDAALAVGVEFVRLVAAAY
ncbi:allantoate amidohydrolase [Granulicella sibirica]|uniref:N-carbamoyl-L-amino acid hydrolase n=1 Tax=Granulicella sibirica TaxID=2479048 RepID=A0A4Q0SZE7_9BACT|nr:allantoate amidohydrolase [Granulicella sibirica]RXH55008.1 N-carbamoyl-L-amino acid hydrolase [Granulicella sibirica]